MKDFFTRVNKFTDKIMPYVLLILVVVIILEFVVKVQNPTAHLIIKILDYIVITVFIIDLISIFVLAPNFKYFFKHAWLDILAVLPFGMFFRLGRGVIRMGQLAERIALGQGVLHGLLKTDKLVEFLSRFEKFSKFFRFVSKTTKKIKNSSFFSKLYDQFYYTKSQFEHRWSGVKKNQYKKPEIKTKRK